MLVLSSWFFISYSPPFYVSRWVGNHWCLCVIHTVIFIWHCFYCALILVACLITLNHQTEGTNNTFSHVSFFSSLKTSLFLPWDNRSNVFSLFITVRMGFIRRKKSQFKDAIKPNSTQSNKEIRTTFWKYLTNLTCSKIRFNSDNNKRTEQKFALTFAWPSKVICHKFSFVVNTPLC